MNSQECVKIVELDNIQELRIFDKQPSQSQSHMCLSFRKKYRTYLDYTIKEYTGVFRLHLKVAKIFKTRLKSSVLFSLFNCITNDAVQTHKETYHIFSQTQTIPDGLNVILDGLT